MNIQTLKIDLATYKEELAQAQKELDNFEYEISESEWDNILDSTESDITVFGMTFSPSYALRNLDYTAYRCGKLDYEFSFDVEECQEYKEIQERISDLEFEIESLEEQIEDLESE